MIIQKQKNKKVATIYIYILIARREKRNKTELQNTEPRPGNTNRILPQGRLQASRWNIINLEILRTTMAQIYTDISCPISFSLGMVNPDPPLPINNRLLTLLKVMANPLVMWFSKSANEITIRFVFFFLIVKVF